MGWPIVTIGRNEFRGQEDAGERRPAGHILVEGTVVDLPWFIRGAVTARLPRSSLEFLMGRGGVLGGGVVPLGIRDDHSFTLTCFFYGQRPDIIPWIGALREDVASLEVRTQEGARFIHPLPDMGEAPPTVLFFPPPSAYIDVLALTHNGETIERAYLSQAPLDPPRSVTGTTVNAAPLIRPVG